MNIHFISGLPRSGSTLLSAILKQNERFAAGMTSPVATIYRHTEDAMAMRQETSVFIDDVIRRRMLKGVFAAYYGASWGHKTIFDTSRMWCARTAALSLLFPDARMICCVRDVGNIMESFERIYQANPLEPSGVYGYDTTGTVYSRVGGLASSNGVVGYALNALREALAGPYADKILLVEYDKLCRDPAAVMDQIYAHIGEAMFPHDFSNVEYSAGEFDRQIGASGLHDVSGPVRTIEHRPTLPPGLYDSFANDQFWRNPKWRAR